VPIQQNKPWTDEDDRRLIEMRARDLQKSGGFWMSLSIRPVQGHRLNKILTTHSVDPTILTGM
jgi:hypothetical protein